MADRRTLLEGMKSGPPPGAASGDTSIEQEFVYGPKVTATKPPPPRTTLNTRIRGDYARTLKRISLERQLNGDPHSTLQEVLEEALEPWMKIKSNPQ